MALLSSSSYQNRIKAFFPRMSIQRNLILIILILLGCTLNLSYISFMRQRLSDLMMENKDAHDMIMISKGSSCSDYNDSNLGKDVNAEAIEESSKEEETTTRNHKIHLKNVQAVDRDLKGVTIDISYNLNVPPNWYDSFETTSPSYNQTMYKLHGHDIWDMKDNTSTLIDEKKKNINHNDSSMEKKEEQERIPERMNEPSLSSFLKFLHLTNSTFKLQGSPLDFGVLKQLIGEIKPKIFLEVGVFHGMTSTWVAKYFKSDEKYKDSYVLSMDTWLLDLQFTWNGIKSTHAKGVTQQTNQYFTGTSKTQGGYSTMYYHFLMNCIKSKTTDRIIPLPTASQNGAMALLSHGIRPDFIYVDASHSNPDVMIDYENFYTILRPGGVIAFDDTAIDAVKAALDALVTKYDLDLHEVNHKQAYIYKIKEKFQ